MKRYTLTNMILGLTLGVSLVAVLLPRADAAIISNVVETGGDNEATDTIVAQWTGKTFTVSVAGEPVASSAIGASYTVGVFEEEAPMYVDRNHQWNGATATLPLPPYLVGSEYIMIGNDNRDNAAFRLDITLSEPALVYILIDNRLTDGSAADPPESGNPFASWTGMSWMSTNGFAPVLTGWNRNSDPSVPDEVGADEGGNGVGPGGDIQNFSSVYSKTVPGGTFSLFQPDNGGRNMYGVVVKRLPNSVNSPPEITNLSPTNGATFYNAAGGLNFTATTAAPNRIETTNINVTINGVNVTSGLVIGGNATARTVSYSSLVANTLYVARIILSDQVGRASTNDVRFDTFNASTAVVIEAEDYNFAVGQFLDAPAPGAYANLTGTQEIDYHDNNVTGLATEYRPAEYVGLAATADAPRDRFTAAGATDYQVTQIQAGDWVDYTRTFANNSYNVYLRASSGTAQRVRLDKITGNRATTNQAPFAVGVFNVPNVSGNPFPFTPLTDASGNLVAVSLSGASTLRLTALSANFDLQMNYLLFAPASAGARPPYVGAASPAAGEGNVSPDAAVRITVANGSTQATQNSVALAFNGTNVTSGASVTTATDGLVITYDPPGLLATNTPYSVRLVFGDSGGASFTNQWTFTTVASITTIPAIYASALGSGQGNGFKLKTRKAPNTDAVGTAFTLPNTALRAEQQLADLLLDPSTGQPYVNEAAGPSGNGLATNAVINFEQGGLPTGYILADAAFPNVDPSDPNNIAMEATAYLELPVGVYRFGVRSDDGFKLTTGAVLTDTNLVLGIYEGGRGDPLPAGATEFDFQVTTGGVYPFRLIWYEGNGGASLEFYSVDRATFRRTLINDANTPGSIKAFLSRPTVVFVPAVAITSPTNKTVYPSVPASIAITADASVVNSRIAKVEFYYTGTNKIGEATSAPYRATWSNVPLGFYTLTAKATDTNGLSTTSAEVSIRVGKPLILDVVETGGDNEATDTVPAKWTGVTFVNGIAGEFPTAYTVPLFGEDVPTYTDRNHQWNGATTALPLPSYLVGGEYILIGNDNRDNATLQLDVTLGDSALVYVLVDNRLSDGDAATPPDFSTGLMAWLIDNGWKPVTNGLNRTASKSVPDEVGVDEGGDGVGPGGAINNWSSVYGKSLPAGTFSLFQPDNPSRNMYGVVVKSAVAAPPVISIAGTQTGIAITFEGTLEQADEAAGPYSAVTGAASPFATPTSQAKKFYRARR